jgi:DNA-binding NtrC family response regulator
VPSILLIDDEVDFADCLREELEALCHTVECLEHAEDGPDRLAAGHFDVVLLDNIMPRMTGLEFLRTLRGRGIKVPIVLMTGDPTSDTAIRAINLGAFDYVIKPGDVQTLARDLQRIIVRAVEFTRPPKEVHVPGHSKAVSSDGPKLVGNSKPMLEVYTRIGQFADLDDPVLILGETGTGKELVAGAFHSFSSRKDKSFVALNCSAIAKELLESELFGHEKGAFTGAEKLRKGMIEYADGGTLFLDEIGEMPLELQGKLLRVLQEREIRRVGGSESIPVDFRLLSATNRNLLQASREGTFREDLYYRLNCIELRLPPLRERLDDLTELVEFFLAQAAAKAGRAQPAVSEEAMAKMRAHRWTGNVRELQNTIRRAFGNCRGGPLRPEHLGLTHDSGQTVAESAPLTEDAAAAALRKAIEWAWDTNQKELWPLLRDMLERELLRLAMERLDGNQSQVAEKLGVVWNTVSKRIKAYGLK